jgi:methylthioribose-1-phosphate isomerase
MILSFLIDTIEKQIVKEYKYQLISFFVILKHIVLMKVPIKKYRTIWLDEDDPALVRVIDQRKLPFLTEIRDLRTVEDVYNSISDMTLRGAPLIGVAGAFGLYLSTFEITSLTDIRDHLANAAKYLVSSRPTAVNLSWAVNYVLDSLKDDYSSKNIRERILKTTNEIIHLETENCRNIGEHGLKLITDISRKKKGQRVNILTHCNAGWLATIEYGTATAPIYLAHEKGIPVHVWVDETRPLNQGARLTAWELGQKNVPYSLIPDNTGGHLMQHGMVDIVIVGSDRTTRNGDVANKIGTYLKALAAHDNKVPFYAALPSTTIDFGIRDGLSEIVIEQRDPDEVKNITAFHEGSVISARICPEDASAVNYAFDVTPARLVTGLITEKGICRADEEEIKKMFPGKFI